MKPNAIMLALLPVFAASNGYAADEVQQAEQQANLNEIVVYGTFAQEKGTQRVTQKDIQNRVTGNGTISEVLKNNLNVQFSNPNHTSNTANCPKLNQRPSE
ncbi:hypothetical protein GJV52_00475 [Neisseria brasiliensis]|uniref:hypothetical protein n=1 Tax=Neisseria TaxID=482 RepID=UPI000C27CD0D|nr:MULTISPECIES: hypothetical protein [Neisseria]PJO78797.1 hypothetical protein CWC45_03445 [Neisseria sp. N177_16]QGL24155.1 hypothetical protein GJV52_00475 [Neisseria brasiliensis]